MKVIYSKEVEIPHGLSVTLASGISCTVVGAVGVEAPGWFWVDYVDPEIGPQRGQYELSTLPSELFPGEAENAQAQRVGIAEEEPPA